MRITKQALHTNGRGDDMNDAEKALDALLRFFETGDDSVFDELGEPAELPQDVRDWMERQEWMRWHCTDD